MNSGHSQVTLRTAGLASGLLAITLGGVVTPVAQASRISCTVTSGSSTNIASVPGFANAVVELAEFACNGVGAGTVPINERVTGVASAMAEAVAEVIGQCSGEGTAMATISGLSRAEARAEAVGTASASILATSQVCELCTSSLEAFSSAVETVSADAFAEASIMAQFTFNEGEEMTFTANDIQRSVEENIIEILSTVTGELHTESTDGCSGNAVTSSQTGDSVAMCDIAISADDILEEVNAVASAGAAVRALACEGGGNEVGLDLVVRDIATAVAQAIVQADSFCESTGGPGTMACGMSSGTVTAVARATAGGFSSGLVEAMGDGCDCDLSAAVDLEEFVEIIATTSTSALVQTCTDGVGFDIDSDFQIEVEEEMAVAVAQFIGSAISGADCSVSISACADAAECVDRFEQCSGPGVEGTLACCNADDVCALLFSSESFFCTSRAFVATTSTAEVLECP